MRTGTSRDEFARIWRECQCSPQLVAKRMGINVRQVYQRRKDMAADGIYLETVPLEANAVPPGRTQNTYALKPHAYEQLHRDTIRGGYVVIFGDAHYWPGEKPLAHEALCIVAKDLAPKLIIGNGDLFDGARISRHDVLGWQKLPTVAEELDACRSRLYEIKRAAPKAKTRATVGNHDSRMDRRLATEVPDFQDIHGMSLGDHLRDWPLSYAILLNEEIDPVFVVHNIKGGIHAPWNNTASTGCHVVTGHLHDQHERTRSLLLREVSGIDHGCLADVDHGAFSYRMARPANWRSGFVVLKFDSAGRMLPPEFCRVQILGNYKRAIFRGEVVCERRVRAAA